jgi:hypothetical protein
MNKYISILTIVLLIFSCKKEDQDTQPSIIAGCMDPLACNYNSTAAVDNSSCIAAGCTDSLALNYDATAGCDDGSCDYPSITDLNIYFTQTVEGNPLISNQMIYTNQAGENYSIQTVRYLISDITLHTDNGSGTILDEVHFIDISIDSTLSLGFPEIANQNYTSISFTMGLNGTKNVTNLFVNESFYPSFSWPEFLGGGYHYMQLEGDFNSVSNGYATHTGGTNGIDFSFSKEFPIIINSENDIRNIYINMEIANWYQNPNILNFVSDGIMDDPNTQVILNENGIEDVFSAYTLESSY